LNYIKHLTGFFHLIIKDDRLNPTHISLYIALFQYWNVNRFRNPISISRSEMMKVSKISAKGTYHKCMRELHDFGYIKYDPSYNPFRGSLVYLINFSGEVFSPQAGVGGGVERGLSKKRTTSGQVLNRNNTGVEQALIPSLNSINALNNVRETGPELVEGSIRGQGIPPLSDIEFFFKKKNYTATEAAKFFNHYKAIGWKIQGITPIQDWHALADKWMQNAKKWETSPSGGSGSESQRRLEDVQNLYRCFLKGEKIFQHITSEHFDQLTIELSDEIMQKAWQQRISQVSGTNQHSLIEIWKAYLSNDPENELLKRDRPNLILVAKKIAVLNHFQTLKQSEVTTMPP
jgi:hypothetical protein